MTILTFVDYYLPGYKSGGPVQSVANLVERLGSDLHFVVVTADRDCGDERPYPGIVPGRKQDVGKAEVIYLKRSPTMLQDLWRVVHQVRPDVLYLNSFFSRPFSIAPILLRRVGLIPWSPVILAPRGEFSIGALRLKPKRKRAFLAVSHRLRLHDDITWQASSPFEEADIRRCIPGLHRDGASRVVVAPIMIAPDLVAAKPLPDGPGTARTKVRGLLRMIFLSRVTRKKNLLGALRMLQQIRGSIELDIYGPIEDSEYWNECQRAIRSLPPNVTVRYAGSVEHAGVSAVMAEHDVFFFPTLGENYGHVILEALMAGCPVLLSDQTPWRSLESAGVGWDLPLEAAEAFRNVIERCVDMDASTFASWSVRASRYGLQKATDPDAFEANRRLFHSVVRAERR